MRRYVRGKSNHTTNCQLQVVYYKLILGKVLPVTDLFRHFISTTAFMRLEVL